MPSRSPATSSEGLRLIDAIEGLDEYRHYHSARADLLRRLGRTDEARDAYRRALALTEDGPERRFLERRLGETAAERARMTPCASPPRSTTPSGPSIELAAVAPEQIKGERLATAQAIPHKFLENILADLRNGGLVASQRGADGGYRLARPPAEITVADVIRVVEGPIASVRGERPDAITYDGSGRAAARRLDRAPRGDARGARADHARRSRRARPRPGTPRR